MVHEFEPHLHTHLKSIETNSEMLLTVVRRLLLGVLGVAVACVHELVVFLPTSRRWRGFNAEQCAAASAEARRSLDPLEACVFAGQIMLSSDVLLAAEPAARRASARLLHRSFGDVFRTQQDHTCLRKAHLTTLGTYPCVPDQWRRLHTRLQGNFSQFVVFYASSRLALTQWRTHRAGCSDEPP